MHHGLLPDVTTMPAHGVTTCCIGPKASMASVQVGADTNTVMVAQTTGMAAMAPHLHLSFGLVYLSLERDLKHSFGKRFLLFLLLLRSGFRTVLKIPLAADLPRG